MKEPVAGWFKLLAQEEGEFYSIPVPSEEGLRIHMKPGMGLVGREALPGGEAVTPESQLSLETGLCPRNNVSFEWIDGCKCR